MASVSTTAALAHGFEVTVHFNTAVSVWHPVGERACIQGEHRSLEANRLPRAQEVHPVSDHSQYNRPRLSHSFALDGVLRRERRRALNAARIALDFRRPDNIHSPWGQSKQSACQPPSTVKAVASPVTTETFLKRRICAHGQLRANRGAQPCPRRSYPYKSRSALPEAPSLQQTGGGRRT